MGRFLTGWRNILDKVGRFAEGVRYGNGQRFVGRWSWGSSTDHGRESGIALGTAKLFAAEAKVAVTDRRQEAIDDAPDLLI